MTKIISISNHKGGCGKTTTTTNLGAALAHNGKRVLLVDLDPQANLSQSLGVDDPHTTIYDMLTGGSATPVEVCENLMLMPSTLDLSGVELELAGEMGREFKLKDALEPMAAAYNYVLIDCPPSLSLLTLNGLVASDEVLIPLQSQYLALQGMTKLLDVIGKIQHRLNRGLKLGGIVVTQYDGRKILNRDVATTIAEHYGSKVFATKIRDNIALAEAPAACLDIFRYNPKSNGAQDYDALAQELLARE